MRLEAQHRHLRAGLNAAHAAEGAKALILEDGQSNPMNLLFTTQPAGDVTGGPMELGRSSRRPSGFSSHPAAAVSGALTWELYLPHSASVASNPSSSTPAAARASSRSWRGGAAAAASSG